MTYSDDAFATILLTQHLFDTGVPPLSPGAFWNLLQTVSSPASLLGLSVEVVAQSARISMEQAERLARLLNATTGLALHLDRLSQSGIQTVPAVGGAVPVGVFDRLKAATPPLLHVAGDLAILTAPSVGLVGSRNVGEPQTAVTAGVAGAAVGAGLTVVSGGARGVDQTAMNAAVEERGRAIGVLADSLTRQLQNSETRRLVSDGAVLLCTPYAPDAPFTVGNAMGRNKLIYALAQATLVVATEADTGGTWAGAKEALAKGYGRVMVWRGHGEGPGNAALEILGAAAIHAPDEFIRKAAEEVGRTEVATVEQLGLGL
jgi:predicted Rossmann fold nucleotide-binding protein DprA/Smf involved in DNA uptake